MTETPTPVLYLDLDGTVREGKGDALGRFVHAAADVRVFPAAIERMKEWRAKGGRIVGVTNQGGVALGHVSKIAMADATIETHRQTGGLFDVIVACYHHPEAKDPEMARCWCRKPSAGAISEAHHALKARVYSMVPRPPEFYPAHLALFVGDRDEDRQCAHNAMIDFQWAADWRAGNGPFIRFAQRSGPTPNPSAA